MGTASPHGPPPRSPGGESLALEGRAVEGLIIGCRGNSPISGWRPVRDGAGFACRRFPGSSPLLRR